MYSIILASIAGIVALLTVVENARYGKTTWQLRLGAILFGGYFGAVGGMVTAVTITKLMPQKEVVYGPYKLVAMRSVGAISGTFVAGTGMIGTSVNYNFMVEQDDGSVSPYSVPVNGNTHITEDPSLHNTGTWTSIHLEVDRNSWLYNWSVGAEKRDVVVKNNLRVPVGTVLQQFSAQ